MLVAHPSPLPRRGSSGPPPGRGPCRRRLVILAGTGRLLCRCGVEGPDRFGEKGDLSLEAVPFPPPLPGELLGRSHADVAGFELGGVFTRDPARGSSTSPKRRRSSIGFPAASSRNYGLDDHPTSGSVLVSVNYNGGFPYNFALVHQDGTWETVEPWPTYLMEEVSK